MAKLTVRNVGPIREAEIDVKKHTVFIGPQGTGKSTLAKLIAMVTDIPNTVGKQASHVLENYNINGYASQASYVSYLTKTFIIELKNNYWSGSLNSGGAEQFQTVRERLSLLREEIHVLSDELTAKINELEENNFKTKRNYYERVDEIRERVFLATNAQNQLLRWTVDETSSIDVQYIPAERTLVAILSEAVWSIMDTEINLPKILTSFARNYELARNQTKLLDIPFINIRYENQQGLEKIIYNQELVTDLSQSASGYQSIVPLLLVTNQQRQQLIYRFIIEEPELNLYPTAQKDLMYSLIGGLQPDVTYQDAEWVITTHSPYVLTSLNTLMLAYKVAQRSDELRAEVEKIIPARCWINPDEFAAYYVDGGTVRSITSEKTGLIADSELDDVSDDFADEQDKLFALSRSVPRA